MLFCSYRIADIPLFINTKMENLKKVISLNKAAQISGYSQDYLGFLIRSGELKGEKMGRSWFTTKESIDNYLFKKKIKQNKFAFREFLSKKRLQNIFLFSIVFVFMILFIVSKTEKKNLSISDGTHSVVILDSEEIAFD